MRSLVVLALLVTTGAGLQAQRKSQRQEIVQMVGDTKIQAMYIRPVARGRDLFGALVSYGKVWTPSADSAMRLTFSTDVTVGGQALKAGSYSVWAIPDTTQWTIVFNTKPNAFHMTHSASDDLLKVPAKVDSLSYVEVLTLSFPNVDGKKAVMQIQWGTTAVTLPIEVP